ncbi:MAG: DNA-binding protein [Bacteroidota bacterium]
MKRKRPRLQSSGLPSRLSMPAQRAFADAGIRQLAQLTRLSERDVKQLHGIGPNALGQLRRALRSRGLAFKTQEKKG